MSINYDPWDDLDLSPEDSIDIYKKKSKSDLGVDPWDEMEFNESFWKNAFRTALQVPQGIAEVTPGGIATGLWQLLGQGAVLDPEEIEQIKSISEREGIPFDEESYMEAAKNALQSVPTVSNIARKIEEKTGIPLEAKTGLQKGLRLGSSVGKAIPGTISQKGVAAATAPITSKVLQELGVPEFIADIAGFGAAGLAAGKTPAIKIEKSKKPSGLTQRRFEKLTEPTSVSQGKIKGIEQTIENEFRNIASDIIEKSPIEKTYSNLKNDVLFKQEAQAKFKDVENLAEQIPQKFSTDVVKKNLALKTFHKKDSGITPSEFDKSKNKFIKEFINETPAKEMSAQDLVKQFRKNNKALIEAYEPGQSFAYNRAKREAISEYNSVIAEMIESHFPDTEFANLFKSTNKQWSEIMDAEAIDKFMAKLFDGKIHFEKGKQFFDKEGMTVPFKRALGEEGFKNFKQLMQDLISTEKAHSLMKVASDKGYKDLASTGLAYVMHPKIGFAKMGLDISKAAYKQLWESLLDKPQRAVTWEKGLKAFKKGDFATAEKEFNKLKETIAPVTLKSNQE